MDEGKTKNKFIKNFENINGFYNLTPYKDAFGFSIKRKLNKKDKENVSLLSFYISDQELRSKKKGKTLNIGATYGKDNGDSVSFRTIEESKISDPTDLTSKGDYYYDINSNKLFHKKREISPSELLDCVYSDHIKPTKAIKGFVIRIKLLFWRIVAPALLDLISKFFHYCLYIITGDRYSFEPILEEETLNDRVISSNWKPRVNLRSVAPEPKDSIKESEKFDFLGYKIGYWSIIFYSLLHLSAYVFFYYRNFKPRLVVAILESNFMTLVYVISSLWIIEKVVPIILKRLIRISSSFSVKSLHKSIKI